MSGPWHPAAGKPLRRHHGPTIDDIERAQAAAREAVEQDRTGLANIRPIRHLHAVYDYELEDEQ